ncbi:MAG TPA: c-type cytochrome [Steroidobacteraceae bacterium]|nr:c-type cytochrome [Steroidobacteraceae bacterium]
MRNPPTRILVLGFVATLWSAYAAGGEPVGDATRGAVVAQACAVCHGKLGEGNFPLGYPRLAGQTENYLRKQLEDFVTGRRSNPLMDAITRMYNEQQRADAAAYYASRSAPYAPAGAPADPRLLARGRLLVRTGDEARQLQACANCHGPDGSGEDFAGPCLVGQSATYVVNVLNEWKSGARNNDGGRQMQVVATRLDEKDAAAVAAYAESLGHAK